MFASLSLLMILADREMEFALDKDTGSVQRGFPRVPLPTRARKSFMPHVNHNQPRYHRPALMDGRFTRHPVTFSNYYPCIITVFKPPCTGRTARPLCQHTPR